MHHTCCSPVTVPLCLHSNIRIIPSVVLLPYPCCYTVTYALYCHTASVTQKQKSSNRNGAAGMMCMLLCSNRDMATGLQQVWCVCYCVATGIWLQDYSRYDAYAHYCIIVPRREAGDVWCLPPVWNLRAVICFHFAISSLVLLPSPVTLSVLSFSACWPFLLNFF